MNKARNVARFYVCFFFLCRRHFLTKNNGLIIIFITYISCRDLHLIGVLCRSFFKFLKIELIQKENLLTNDKNLTIFIETVTLINLFSNHRRVQVFITVIADVYYKMTVRVEDIILYSLKSNLFVSRFRYVYN